MHVDPQLWLLALTTGAGCLMIEAGLVKNTLERRRQRRTCPSCGRARDACGCF